MTVEKAIPKKVLRPMTKGANNTINRLELLPNIPVTCSESEENHMNKVRFVLRFIA